MAEQQLIFPHPMSLQVVLEQSSGDAITYTYNVSRPVTFGQLLGLLERLTPERVQKPNAFDYEDEEEERVTVRTDDELTAMMAFYFWECRKQGEAYNLQIFPRFPPKLQVDTTIKAPEVSGAKPPKHTEREGVDLQGILNSGQIQASDLQLLEILGHGNGGTVYRALHQTKKVIMAVKLIPVDVTEQGQRMIMSELSILHQCDSDYVIQFYGAFFTENRISICTEYMNGGSLDQYMPIPEVVLGRVAVQVVKGMVYLWEQRNGRIMHRDIKPSNVLVSLNGSVKLCDFGVSVHMVKSTARSFVGTNAYMAPERIQGEPYSINSEIWSLGLSLVEMAMGRFPYLANSDSQAPPASLLAIELLQMVVNEEPPFLLVPPFSIHFSDFCSQCMKKRPESRISIGELLKHPFMVAMSDYEREMIAAFVRDKLDSVDSQAHRQNRLVTTFEKGFGTMDTSSPHNDYGPPTPIAGTAADCDAAESVGSAGTVTGPWDNAPLNWEAGTAVSEQSHPLAESGGAMEAMGQDMES